MDKFGGANTPRRAEGQEPQAGDDFEMHPVGTAERLRQIAIIGARAAEIIEGLAQDLYDTETIKGEWPAPGDEFSDKARADYDDWTAVAGFLRALCAPPVAAVAPEVNPAELPDEDFTIPIYPWPTNAEIEP